MSKRLHTIESPNKKKLIEETNLFLEFGCELVEGSYEIIKKDDKTIYSQVIQYDTNKLIIEFYRNGQIKKLKQMNENDGNDELWTEWYENGQKQYEINYKDGQQNGLYKWWYENGQKSSEGPYKDGKPDGVWISYNRDGTVESRRTYKDGVLVK